MGAVTQCRGNRGLGKMGRQRATCSRERWLSLASVIHPGVHSCACSAQCCGSKGVDSACDAVQAVENMPGMEVDDPSGPSLACMKPPQSPQSRHPLQPAAKT